jgi:hypothetical protein
MGHFCGDAIMGRPRCLVPSSMIVLGYRRCRRELLVRVD